MRRGILSVACLLALSAALAGSAQAASYDTDTVIVKLASGVSAQERAGLFAATGVSDRVGSVAGVGADVVRVQGDPADVARRLNRSLLVSYAEPNFILTASAVPNDPLFGELYGLNNTGQTGGRADADIDAPEGWDAAGLGAFPATGGVKIGIVDTGIDQTHPELSGKTVNCADSVGGTVVEGTCVDDSLHGTHVAGTIAAKANNATGVAGVAFNSSLVICKALRGGAGVGLTSDVANCITWAHSKGAKVISMSLGGGQSTTLQSAVAGAWENGSATGSVLIAAAGNDGNSTVSYPAGYAQVVSVAATDDNDAKASFSNTNADVEVAAPGVDVLSTIPGGQYFELSGTSMATPHASGVAGVLWQLFPTDTAAGIRSRLTSSVDDLGPAGRDPSFGFGRVNLCKAAGGGC
ncbi:MAG TPA: S8 family serine peptidase [Thermoleophilaceae bacterium]|nr:S8 family serine peptidase [Thermoleophilaceae bacterium]